MHYYKTSIGAANIFGNIQSIKTRQEADEKMTSVALNNTNIGNNNTSKKSNTSNSNNNNFSSRVCIFCKERKKRKHFSATQWKKTKGSKCKLCTGATDTQVKRGSSNSEGGAAKKYDNNNSSATTTPLLVKSRPQMSVPGFECLTCCTDWPQTKKGEPPNAQSLIFMPLFAIIHGPLEGFCNELQLLNALKWWTAALPSFPSWIDRLKKVGVKCKLEQLVAANKSMNGRPIPLIPKIKGGGYGSFPHIKGKVQTRLLEMETMVSIEIYQAVACMYSQRKMSEANS